MNYEKQAIDFLAKTNVAFKTEFVKNAPYFADDKNSRDIYQITLTRGERTNVQRIWSDAEIEELREIQ